MKLIIIISYAFLHHSVSIKIAKNITELEEDIENEYTKIRLNHGYKRLQENPQEPEQNKLQMRHFKLDNDSTVMNIIDNSNHAFNINQENNFLIDKIKAKITKTGYQKLKYLATKIKDYLKPSFEIDELLDDITEKYAANLDTYFNSVRQQEVYFVIDKELYYLYIVESSSKIFNNFSRILLHTIVEMSHAVQHNDIIMLTKNIQAAVVDEKRANLNFICEKLTICKPFPSYLDHVAELLSAILSLPDTKFQNIVNILKELVGVKLKYYKFVMNDEIARKISYRLKSLAASQKDLSKFLSLLKGIINDRYHIFRSKDGEIKTRTKAIRILIDMIDKAFEVLGEEFVEIAFDNILKSIKLWAVGERDEVKTILSFATNNFFDVLNHSWDVKTKEEVKVIIEVIMTGTSENNIVHDDLFTKGSEFIQNDNIGFGLL